MQFLHNNNNNNNKFYNHCTVSTLKTVQCFAFIIFLYAKTNIKNCKYEA